MSESIAMFHHRPAGCDRRRVNDRFRSVLLGLIIVALGFAVVASTVVPVASNAERAIAEPLPEYPARELSAEWRWERKPVEFEHMYRHKESLRVDWIRSAAR